MAGVRIVPASERLDRLEFSPKAEFQDHCVHIGSYICPRCDFLVDLHARHFLKHEGLKDSNLEVEWRTHFDAARPLNASRWESFLDFHCPGCKAPVRVIYEPGDEYAMSAHSWLVLEVLEADEWQVPRTEENA